MDNFGRYPSCKLCTETFNMTDPDMAELEICNAPLASFEGEDWNEFQSSIELNCDVNGSTDCTLKKKFISSTECNFNETFSGSLEDLVNTFDDAISKCFCNYERNVEEIAPVQVRSLEEIVNDCQLWWTLTGNFGNVLPIDWSKTYTRELQIKALNLSEPKEDVPMDLDLSDDEELTQSFDMHSIVISSLHLEPLATADEVIDEIEELLDPDNQGNSPYDAEISPLYRDLLQLRNNMTPTSLQTTLQKVSIPALNQLFDETEALIQNYSETLIQELALRDELEYEKELKNQFISLLLNVQKRRREWHHLDKRKGKKNQINKNQINNGNGPSYLTTVIPYHNNQGSPTSQELQNYMKILKAINDDNPEVPTLLTDYILKVVCPT